MIRSRMVASAEAFATSGAGLPEPQLVQAIAEGTPENEFLFIRGSHRNPGPEQPRRSLTALQGVGGIEWDRISGSGRLEWAREMTDPGHPLVARVMVNRVWHHLFGRGLVTSPDNFGIMGNPPTHPELLDWLARGFVADGWSVKRLVRRIMLSRAWQLSADIPASVRDADPLNLRYARCEPRRMDGESIRDSILSISGQLDPALYGPPVPVHLTDFMQGRGRPGQSGPLDGAGRRSIYLEVRRNFLDPMMLVFDTPIPFNATGRRNDSNVPAQALVLMNDPFVLDQAEKWARRLIAGFPDPDQRMDQAWLAATGRTPDARQRAGCNALLEEFGASASGNAAGSVEGSGAGGPRGQGNDALQTGESGEDAELVAWTALCHVLWNAKSFVFVW